MHDAGIWKPCAVTVLKVTVQWYMQVQCVAPTQHGLINHSPLGLRKGSPVVLVAADPLFV